eukprot:CAMPEP_0119528788 /NCGR_PEP_ID=MMETSP1344-20130328/42899_1 /TAXON_ID=236787 /ORGANISM="Florenciella parvula, Strain CCMP2471" /LENGTH=56 /DNA_ID=CAMNT_0007568245 /DNA_START=13 /DNA_END=179 /DNA_ORIENTATION=-
MTCTELKPAVPAAPGTTTMADYRKVCYALVEGPTVTPNEVAAVGTGQTVAAEQVSP